MNAHGVGEIALAGATSTLFAMLADSYRRSKKIQHGDEIIIHDSSHEVPPSLLYPTMNSRSSNMSPTA